MAKLIELNIRGIKCDMPGCDYQDDTAKFEDYHLWLNRPCPCCRGNLLTQRDMDFARRFKRRIAIVNFMFGWLTWFHKPATVGRSIDVQTDGRGIPTLVDRGLVKLDAGE